MTMAKIKTFAQKLMPWRIWVQISFLAVWLDPLALRIHSLSACTFHCYACPLATFACPIGVLHQFAALHLIPFVTVGILVGAGALLGGFICGWFCPIGLLQDLFSRIPVRKFSIPGWVRHFRYVTLFGFVILIPYLFGTEHFLAICQVCPIGSLESSLPRKVATPLINGESIVWNGSLIWKMCLLGVFLAAMLLTYRPWCRICPLGLIFGWFNRFSAIFLKFDPVSCTSCKVCHKLCDIRIKPENNPVSSSCIRCLECTRCNPQSLSLGNVFTSKREQSHNLAEK